MPQNLIHCPRCRGAAGVPRESLLADEPAVMVDVFSHTVECPTCTRFGPFGLVPIPEAIEGALIGSGQPTQRQVDGAAWLRNFLEE